MKQLIFVRSDLKLSIGKLAVQVAHASVGACLLSTPHVRKKWIKEGTKKVVLKVKDKKELLAIKRNEFVSFLVCDAGLTELASGTITVLAIGPADDNLLDKYFKRYKLL